PGHRSEGHQKLRLDRLEEPGKLLPLEKRADREGDPRGFATPDGEMRFGKVRQNEGDRVAALDPEAAKEIARLGDAAEQLAMRPDRRLFEPARLSEKCERGRVRRDRRAGAQHVVGRRRNVPLRERRALDGEHVVISRDRHRSDAPAVNCSNFRHGAPPALWISRSASRARCAAFTPREAARDLPTRAPWLPPPLRRSRAESPRPRPNPPRAKSSRPRGRATSLPASLSRRRRGSKGSARDGNGNGPWRVPRSDRAQEGPTASTASSPS